jgi:hypothetical protein
LIKTAAAVSRLMNDQRPEALRVHGAMVGWRAQDQQVIKVGNGKFKFILEKISLLSFLSQTLTQSLSSLSRRRRTTARRLHLSLKFKKTHQSIGLEGRFGIFFLLLCRTPLSVILLFFLFLLFLCVYCCLFLDLWEVVVFVGGVTSLTVMLI